MTAPSRDLLKRYADTLAKVTHPYALADASIKFRSGPSSPSRPEDYDRPFTPELRAIYDANRKRLAGKSSPNECQEAVRKVIDNA
jgi:hypothetical protein